MGARGDVNFLLARLLLLLLVLLPEHRRAERGPLPPATINRKEFNLMKKFFYGRKQQFFYDNSSFAKCDTFRHRFARLASGEKKGSANSDSGE
jgi:hypothetical protein